MKSIAMIMFMLAFLGGLCSLSGQPTLTPVPVEPGKLPTGTSTIAPTALPSQTPSPIPPTPAPTDTPAPWLAEPVALDVIPLPGDFNPYSFDWSPDGSLLAAGAVTGVIGIWEMPSQKLKHTMWKHTGIVDSLAFSRDGNLLASGSSDTSAMLWTSSGVWKRTLLGHTNVITALAWSVDGSALFSLSYDDTIRIWDTESGKQTSSPITDKDILGMALSPDGSLLATSMFTEHVALWDAATGQKLRRLEGFSDRVGSVAFSPNGLRLFARSLDGMMTVWDSATWERLWSAQGLTGPIYSAAWSPDGRFIAAGTLNENLTLWDAANGKLLYQLNVSNIRGIDWSPDGSQLAVINADGIHLWQMTLVVP